MTRTIVVMGVCGSGKTAAATSLAGARWMPMTCMRRRQWPRCAQGSRWSMQTASSGWTVSEPFWPTPQRNARASWWPARRFVGSTVIAFARPRMAQRRDHYMPTSLLDSQLPTVEHPGADEPDVLRIDIDQPLTAVVQQARAALQPSDSAAAESPTEPRP
jgi:hypothetical protein